MDLGFAVGAFATIFAIINPVANVPIIESVTAGFPLETKKRVAVKICLVTFGTLLIFGLFGQWIFSIYGITIPTFKVAGGILLFFVSFSMLQGEWSKTKISEEERDELSVEQLGIVPLGIPLHAGPGSITTVMILVSETISAGEVLNFVSIFVAVGITVLITYLLLVRSHKVFALIGKSGAMAFTRVMGILLAAVAINFIYSGTLQFLVDSGVL